MPSTPIQQNREKYFNTEQLKGDFCQRFPYITLGDDKYGFSKDRNEMVDWWLSKFSDYRAALITEIEGKKKEMLGRDQHGTELYIANTGDMHFNKGLQTAIDIINQEK